MTELRDVDLRFTPAETSVLFNQVLGFNLSPADIEALEGRTEGWTRARPAMACRG